MEGVLDFDNFDVELDEGLLKKKSSRCTDDFLTSLCLEDGDEDFIIPVFENVEDNTTPVEEEPLDDEQVEDEALDEGGIIVRLSLSITPMIQT
ncbi:unnamed protein product [Lactuca virosa]|uniref:Uncharacterized protein n=1 Tax=Lactuca virosa TaxID=75947 RepID=A0AAU9NKU8_9ASTR|nr:unnamed protein product [Lactuca virosa]